MKLPRPNSKHVVHALSVRSVFVSVARGSAVRQKAAS
jgi:hypothetical protein